MFQVKLGWNSSPENKTVDTLDWCWARLRFNYHTWGINKLHRTFNEESADCGKSHLRLSPRWLLPDLWTFCLALPSTPRWQVFLWVFLPPAQSELVNCKAHMCCTPLWVYNSLVLFVVALRPGWDFRNKCFNLECLMCHRSWYAYKSHLLT